MRRSLCLLVLLGCFGASAAETMRIQMGEVDGQVELRGAGLCAGPDSEEGPYRALGSDRVVVRRAGDRLEVNGAPWETDVLRLRTGGPEAAAPGNAPVHAGSWEVRGDVVVRLHKERLQLINVIPLEEYVAAVLGGEMPVTFPSEALKAQAVAARTYALQRKLELLDAPYYVGSSVLSQVYGGVHREDARTRAATEATRGEIITFELSPIEAYFHASCGGRTESGLSALNRDLPYLKPVDCPCGRTSASRWSLKIPVRELEEDFHAAGPLTVVARSSTGRARRVRVGARSLDATVFRQRLGYDRVKSLSFEVEPSGPDTFVLSGRGYGHGAGLCQWGAKLLAEDGWSYTRILEHYYPGTELQRLY